MPFVIWDDSFVLGVRQFDEHHQHLVGLLNQAYDDFTTGAPPERVDKILDELVNYANYHFAAEELWLQEQSFPKITEHRTEHDRFSCRVLEMLKDQENDKVYLMLETMSFLNNWLTNHILKSDAEYGRYYAAIN